MQFHYIACALWEFKTEDYLEYERDYLKRNEQRDMIMGAFQKRLQAVSEQSKADGIIEGENRGEINGEINGEIKVLKRQLTLRFGPLPTWALEKLQSASTEQLEAWAERIFDAGSLESFFE